MSTKWIVLIAISIVVVGASVWFVSNEAPDTTVVDTLTVETLQPVYVAVASKLSDTQANACAEAVIEKLGTSSKFMIANKSVLMPPVNNSNKRQLISDLGSALSKSSPQSLTESSMTLKTAIISATSSSDSLKRTLVVVGQLPIDMNMISNDQKSVLLDPTDVARLSERTNVLDIIFVVLPGTASSNDAIIRLRGLLNRKGVTYDSVLVSSGGISK